MRRLFAFLLIVFCGAISLLAQTTATQTLTPEQKAQAMKKAQQQLSQMTKEQLIENAKRTKSRFPAKKNFEAQVSQAESKQNNAGQSAQTLMPQKVSIPGEYEETQGVFLSWSYYAFNKDGDFLDPVTKDFGLKYLNQSGTNFEVQPIAVWIVDTVAQSSLGPLWAKLANAIQQETPVWLVIYQPSDSTTLKNYMKSLGMPLTNYRFFVVNGGNAFWMRDFGPIGFYYGDQDSIGFLDLHYYPGRAADDTIPELLGKQLGYKVFTTDLQAEGGNFMTDGWGNTFISSRVNSANNVDYAQAFIVKNSKDTTKFDVKYSQRAKWTSKKTLDTMKNVFASSRVTVLPELLCDGGTGHIDMYTKLFDDETVINTVYPEEFNKSSFRDYKTAKASLDTLRKLKTAYQRDYRIFTMPVPTGDEGSYDSTTCSLFNADPRGFLNGLTINKTYIYPIFSDENSGNQEQSEEAKHLYEQYLPGYKLVPFDSRLLTKMAGAVHCITMQVPAENPIRFKHAALRGVVPAQATYPLGAVITNRSGIANAKVMWRKKGTSTWTSLTMTGAGSDFDAILPGNADAVSEAVEYYLEAQSNNGKTMRYPITAPEGYFTFMYGSGVSSVNDNIYGVELMEPYPNPAQEKVSVPFSIGVGGETEFVLFDAAGREVRHISVGRVEQGLYIQPFSVAGLPTGVYALSLKVNGMSIAMKKVVVY